MTASVYKSLKGTPLFAQGLVEVIGASDCDSLFLWQSLHLSTICIMSFHIPGQKYNCLAKLIVLLSSLLFYFILSVLCEAAYGWLCWVRASYTSVQALNNPHVTSKLIDDTITQLNLLGKSVKSLSLHRIEAHKGHVGNEKADELARAEEFRTIMDESIDAPAGYDKQTLWAACYKQWTTEWQQLTTCRMTKKDILSQARQKQN